MLKYPEREGKSYDNLEVKILCHFSEDKKLQEAFMSGVDIHGSTAVNMFNLDCSPSECKKKYPVLRQIGKTLNFLKTADHTA